MVWYVALVAILNLGLGYGLAVFLGVARIPSLGSRFGLGESLEVPAVVDQPLVKSPAEPAVEVATAESADTHSETDAPATAEATSVGDVPSVPATDPNTGLTTREHVEKQLAHMARAHTEAQPVTVALLEIAQADVGGEGVDDRLVRGIAGTVRELLAEVHTAGRYSDQQFLLILPQDDLQHATQRAEQVRQRIAATQYIADGQQIQATVTCALAQVAASQSSTHLLEFLEETLEEAKRYGGNRTFMHDGTSPTPVVPPELNVAPQTCAI
jgi:diguanylate cyclase (GGDEF)-like protein